MFEMEVCRQTPLSPVPSSHTPCARAHTLSLTQKTRTAASQTKSARRWPRQTAFHQTNLAVRGTFCEQERITCALTFFFKAESQSGSERVRVRVSETTTDLFAGEFGVSCRRCSRSLRTCKLATTDGFSSRGVQASFALYIRYDTT